MSIESLVRQHVAGNRHADADVEEPAPAEEAASLSIGSMWVLEGTVSLAAILTALLIGIGR